MDPLTKPKNTDEGKSVPHPVVSGSANQTNARSRGMLTPPVRHYADGTSDVPQLPAAAASDPGWAARLSLAQKLNPTAFAPQPAAPPSPNIPLFSRALPAEGGAPTPSFAPNSVDDAKAGLAALFGLTPAHAAQGQAMSAVPVKPGAPQYPAWADQEATSASRASMAQMLNTRGGQLSLADNGTQPVGMNHGSPIYYTPQGDATPAHPVHNPHQFSSRDEFIAAARGTPLKVLMQAWQARKIPSMQNQAQQDYVAGAPDAKSFAQRILDIALGARMPMPAEYGQDGVGGIQ